LIIESVKILETHVIRVRSTSGFPICEIEDQTPSQGFEPCEGVNNPKEAAMCEFCVKPGDGEKWYLAMQNYSRELLERDDRLGYMEHFVNTFEDRVPGTLSTLERIKHSPLHQLSRPIYERTMRRDHFGQVVPIEEIETILRGVDGIARLPCVCRMVTTGDKNARYCYILTGHPQLAEEVDDSFNLEHLDADEAMAAVRKHDDDGLIHSVWTFKTPYIGAICNCDQDCVAYRICHAEDYFKMMFRAEWVAEVVTDACNGCRNCMRHCQFGAIRFSAAQEKVTIDARQCYGCGLCRSVCHKDAITLTARDEHPVAAEVWL
jgi:ferredoxin